MPEPQLLAQAPPAQPQPYSARRTLLRAVLATAALGAATVAATQGWTGGIFFAQLRGDNVTDAKARLEQFQALPPVALAAVPSSETAEALSQMNLAPLAQLQLAQALEEAAGQAANPAPGVAAALPPAAPDAARAAEPASQVSPAPAATAAPAPKQANTSPTPAPAARVREQKPPQLRLVRITLWDTDAEDGDEVRIESQGYSRLVKLTKAPTMLVVPVPSAGTLNVVGVRDGEGGGITVGLASGASRAVFPVMSEGQVLGLRVVVP